MTKPPSSSRPRRTDRRPGGDGARRRVSRQDGAAEPPRPRIGSARGGAVALLDLVLGQQRLLSDAVGPGGPLDRLEAAEKARAQRLATEVLRGLERCDRLLETPLRKIPPLPILNILRLGTWELCNGEAAHGVVNDCVALAAATPRGDSMKGLVNAVLRKIAETGPTDWPRMRVPRLPDWLREPLVEAWGGPAVTAMEAAHFAGAPLDLTPRDPRDAADLAADLGAEVLATGSLRLTAPGQVSALAGYDGGRWWVQDAAAALPARMLTVRPGESVLDLCAAPGGKTMQLAAAGAEVVALDLSSRRMERVAENLARTGLRAQCVTGDALEHSGGPYDAILLDAPCSATGTIRRHPDLPHATQGQHISDLIELQARLIDHAVSLLAPGGRLVFCTCSLIPDEGECQAEEALARHPDLSIDTDARDLPGVPDDWKSAEGGMRIRPDFWADKGGIDGFYIAAFRRRPA